MSSEHFGKSIFESRIEIDKHKHFRNTFPYLFIAGDKETLYMRMNGICNDCKNKKMWDSETKEYYCANCDS
jgi:hypothetical protein